jgi:hypothetical protein
MIYSIMVVGLNHPIIVNGSVNFENEPVFRTEKVHYEAVDDMLPPEFETEQLTISHYPPDCFLCFSRFFAEAAGQVSLKWSRPRHDSTLAMSCQKSVTISARSVDGKTR